MGTFGRVHRECGNSNTIRGFAALGVRVTDFPYLLAASLFGGFPPIRISNVGKRGHFARLRPDWRPELLQSNPLSSCRNSTYHAPDVGLRSECGNQYRHLIYAGRCQPGPTRRGSLGILRLLRMHCPFWLERVFGTWGNQKRSMLTFQGDRPLPCSPLKL